MSTCPLMGSAKSDGLVAPLGTVVGWACVHVDVAPSQSHVSFRNASPRNPPNRTTFLMLLSYAIVAEARAPGLTGVCICFQVLPSYVQVSPNSFTSSVPPNTITFLLIGS